MLSRAPTKRDAEAALAEAARHAAWLRRTDDRYRLVLLALAAVYVAMALLVLVPPMGPPGLDVRLAVPAVLACGLVASVVALARMRARGRRGEAWFGGSIAAFSIWNAVVISISSASGWWGHGTPAVHFTVSAVVAVVPLVAGAALMGWNRR
jgi:hypothetical protein